MRLARTFNRRQSELDNHMQPTTPRARSSCCPECTGGCRTRFEEEIDTRNQITQLSQPQSRRNEMGRSEQTRNSQDDLDSKAEMEQAKRITSSQKTELPALGRRAFAHAYTPSACRNTRPLLWAQQSSQPSFLATPRSLRRRKTLRRIERWGVSSVERRKMAAAFSADEARRDCLLIAERLKRVAIFAKKQRALVTLSGP